MHLICIRCCGRWPDNWNVHKDEAFQKAWLEKHAQDAANVLKKPLLLEE